MIKLLRIGLCTLLLTACGTQTDHAKEKNMSEQKTLSIRLGEMPDDFSKRMKQDGYTPRINQQPAGLNFFKDNFPLGQRKTARVEHGQYSFEIPNVMSYTGTENVDFKEEGIAYFRLSFVLKDDGKKNTHDAARLFFFGFLQKLHNLGWQRVLIGEPRLIGEQTYKYYLEENDYYTPDISFAPSLEVWEKLEDRMVWGLHASDMFMQLTYTRRQDPSEKTPSPESAYYLFSLKIQTKENYAKSYMEYEQRNHWKKYWVAEMKRLKVLRYEEEAELIKKGYVIDTDYQDPIIHPSDPVEPDGYPANKK